MLFVGVDDVGGFGYFADDLKFLQDLIFGLGPAQVDNLDSKDHVGVVLVDGFVDGAVVAAAEEVQFQDVGLQFVGHDVVQLDQFDVLAWWALDLHVGIL